MFGAIKVGGSGSYLDSMRSKTNTSSMTSRMYIQTEQHSILMRNEEVADLIGNKHCYGLMAKKKDFDSRMKLLSKPIEVGASSPRYFAP